MVENVHIRLVIRNYDQITPIMCGDVVAEGIDLELDRDASMAAFLEDDTYHAGEMSFSGYLRRLAAGDKSTIGLPIFLARGFRQRCFFVRRDSGIHDLKDLAGKRVGTNGWPDTGNTWSRALLRAAGVQIQDVQWWVGTIDGVTDQVFGHRVTAPNLPANVALAGVGRTLEDMLLADDLDALMIPWPPRRFHEPDSPIVRLIPDYRRVEQEYARRVGFYPAHHLLGVRANVLTQHPEAIRSLYEAFERSRQLAEERRWLLADTTPWLLPELEEVQDVLGSNWQAHGLEPNQQMIRALCQEIYEQGLVAQPIDPDDVFADFARVMD